MTFAPRPPGSAIPDERRKNLALRELLDEMIELTRHLLNRHNRLEPAELRYARERMEWLADEIWDQATHGTRED